MSDAPPPRLIGFTHGRRQKRSAFLGWATIELSGGVFVVRCPTHASRGAVIVLPPVCEVRNDAGRLLEKVPVLAFETAEQKYLWCRAAGAAVLAAHPDILTQPYD